MSERTVTHVYVGRYECGCIVAVTSDDPTDRRRTSKSVAEFIHDGLTIDHITLEAFRAGKLGCSHRKTGEFEERASQSKSDVGLFPLAPPIG